MGEPAGGTVTCQLRCLVRQRALAAPLDLHRSFVDRVRGDIERIIRHVTIERHESPIRGQRHIAVRIHSRDARAVGQADDECSVVARFVELEQPAMTGLAGVEVDVRGDGTRLPEAAFVLLLVTVETGCVDLSLASTQAADARGATDFHDGETAGIFVDEEHLRPFGFHIHVASPIEVKPCAG